MKILKKNGKPEKTGIDFSTDAVWKKCGQVEKNAPRNSGVEKLKNCGVEREKMWKILWIKRKRRKTFHSGVERDFMEKVEIYFRAVQIAVIPRFFKMFFPQSFKQCVENSVENLIL